MNEQLKTIDLQIDHPEVDDLQKDFQAKSLKAHILSLIHRWPYEQLMVQARNKNVLELGCNKGFGTIIYAEYANSIKAVDTSSAAIEKAGKYNARENIEYICLNSWTLPFDDNTFDLTVLFQVIEHIALDKRDIFLREIKRVTRTDGQVIVSTPNRNIRLLPFQKPWNKFHTKEYSAQDLKQLLSRYFVEVRVEGLFGAESLNEIERRRVRQKPSKVYLKEPLRKYLVRPILGWVPENLKAAIEGALARRTKTEAKNSYLPEANGVATESADYPFSTSDLEFRGDSLHEALDLRATVLRIE
ncbi:MAG: class I SAM-dependent methyltransferase [Gammaproteobacteria bacterium]|nr:class I SAM-dependent methyltransferase [Gammaproteobacteria bacterium]